jgi:hypothetical protein
MYIDSDVNLNENEHLVQEKIGLQIEEEKASDDGIACRNEYVENEIETEDKNTNDTTLTTFQRNVAEDFDFNDVNCTLTGDCITKSLKLYLQNILNVEKLGCMSRRTFKIVIHQRVSAVTQ